MATKKGISILVIEDEPSIATALKLKLEHEGFSVDIAGNGAEGVPMATKGKYDLILMDLVMPEMDGFAVLEAFKEKGFKTPVIVSSNLSQDEDIEKAKKLGAVDYYVKSNIPLSAIVDRVKENLEKVKK